LQSIKRLTTDNYAGEDIRVTFRYDTGMNHGGTGYVAELSYFVHSS
jgi:hypothetical protein